jgi:hypothetical protein
MNPMTEAHGHAGLHVEHIGFAGGNIESGSTWGTGYNRASAEVARTSSDNGRHRIDNIPCDTRDRMSFHG